MTIVAKKYFTVAEADAMLPEVSKSVEKLMTIADTLETFDEIKLGFEDDFAAVAHEVTKNKNFHKLSHDLYAGIEQLLQQGIIVKDLEMGLADFFAQVEGKEIFLCWKAGEAKIGHWHEINAGFKNRKPISSIKEKFQS